MEETVRDPLSAFAGVSPRLFGIAYRMLGSVSEAEDIVQEVWLRWQTADRSSVLEPSAFLATITTRLAINFSQSARSRRESYVGTWLPDPVNTSDDPHLGAERGEALELAVLLLLEKLTPTERAAYVLREAFDYSYEKIAEILRSTEANTRQLVSRARQHINNGRQASVSKGEQRRLLAAFVDAARKGDRAALETVFAEDVMSSADGGGIVRASRRPVSGRERVAKFIAAVASDFWTDVTLSFIEANTQPAVVVSRNGEPVTLVTIEASAQGIEHILWMMRPSKLTAVARLSSDVAAGLKTERSSPPATGFPPRPA
jgi:RNA polymerase sigma-70 factor (TIGR02957 family)